MLRAGPVLEFVVQVDADLRLATITWNAPRPDVNVFRRGFAALLADPAFQPHFGVVSDWRAVREAPDSEFVREFVMQLEAVSRRGVFVGPWATVLSKGALAVYGMGRMTELLTETARFDYAMFTGPGAAAEWVVRVSKDERAGGAPI